MEGEGRSICLPPRFEGREGVEEREEGKGGKKEGREEREGKEEREGRGKGRSPLEKNPGAATA